MPGFERRDASVPGLRRQGSGVVCEDLVRQGIDIGLLLPDKAFHYHVNDPSRNHGGDQLEMAWPDEPAVPEHLEFLQIDAAGKSAQLLYPLREILVPAQGLPIDYGS